MLVWWLHASLAALVFPEGQGRGWGGAVLGVYQIGLVILPELVELLQLKFLPGMCAQGRGGGGGGEGRGEGGGE